LPALPIARYLAEQSLGTWGQIYLVNVTNFLITLTLMPIAVSFEIASIIDTMGLRFFKSLFWIVILANKRRNLRALGAQRPKIEMIFR